MYLPAVLRIRISFNADPDPDPAFFPNADPDPDPGFFKTLDLEKQIFLLTWKKISDFFGFLKLLMV